MFKDASRFGRLIVILNSDEWLIRKKGYIFMTFEERKEIIDNYGIDVFDEFRDYIENEKDLSYKNTFEEKLKNSIMRRRFIRKIIDDATDKLNY